MSANRPTVVILLLAAAPLLAQEVVKKERQRIRIDWATYEETKNYRIEYESVIPLTTVQRIAGELEDVLVEYIKVFRFQPKEKFKVKFLESQNTYEQEGGIPSAPGFYSAATDYLVLLQQPFQDLIPTVYHEAFHQYLQHHVGRETEIPTWFNEGMASYYEGMQRRKGDKKLDHKLIDKRKLRMIKDKVLTRAAVPLQDLVNRSYEEFHDKEDRQRETLHYSQSFALIYFFMDGMGGKPIVQFTAELKKTKDVEAAYEKLFGKQRKNLKAVEKKWLAYMSGLDLGNAS